MNPKPYLLICPECDDELEVCETLDQVEMAVEKRYKEMKDVEIIDEPEDSKTLVFISCEMCDWSNS